MHGDLRASPPAESAWAEVERAAGARAGLAGLLALAGCASTDLGGAYALHESGAYPAAAETIQGIDVARDADRIWVLLERGKLLQDGGLGFAAAHHLARMRDPTILALRERIRLVPDAELTRALPPRQAIVEIATRDGRTLAHHARAVRGTPEDPMDRREVEAKARDLLSPVLGPERARALIAEIWRIERLASVRALRPLLQA